MTYAPRFSLGDNTHFFHLRLAQPASNLLIQRVDVWRMALRLGMRQWPFVITDAVVLPGEFLTILHFPDGDTNYAQRWRLIKSVFSRHVPAPETAKPARKGDKGIWRQGYEAHLMRDTAEYCRYRERIIMAPVRAGLVVRPHDWAWSSVHRDDFSTMAAPPLPQVA